MNASTIEQLAAATLNGSIPFPEIVGRLIEEEVEYYLVDYRALRFSFYGIHGGVVVAPLQFEALPQVGESFDLPSLRAAIHDSQSNGQKFRDFSSRAVRAGVQSYCVFLRGKRVLYLGRQGDQHVERFPGAAPLDAHAHSKRVAAASSVAPSMGTRRVVEIRSYKLRPGSGAAFHALVSEHSVPLLRAAHMDVVAFGSSLHDPDAYCLVRSYESMAHLQSSQDAFYASAAWRQGPREAIIALIESDANTVMHLTGEALDALRQSGMGVPA